MKWMCEAPVHRLLQILMACLSVLVAADPVLAADSSQDSVQDELYTAYLRVNFGLSTYKSKMVESNDTGTIVEYAIGANVGTGETFGLMIRNDTSAINFELNESSVASSWRDTIIRYRWGYAYLGGVLGNTSFEVKKAGEEHFSGSGSGYGGNFGILIPMTRGNTLYLDATSVTISEFIEKDKKEVKFGPRTDVNFGATIALTKRWLDAMFGYRYRTHSITVDSTSNAELHSATYLGLCLGADF